MDITIPGLHHVTAISGLPQPNVDFYTGPLGQRLVKRTVNFDAPEAYHLYYGNRAGAPGTILTFFLFNDAGPGRAGAGMTSAVAYGLSPADFEALMLRLAEDAVDFDGPGECLGERFVTLRDPDGLAVEVVEAAGSEEGGFYSVTLWLADPDPTARLLTDAFGYTAAGSEMAAGAERLRFRADSGGPGSVVDLLRSDAPSIGRSGAGTIHHVAFRAASDAELGEWQQKLAGAGLRTTPIIDRQYFHSIYFREPGGVLFEIATDPPGFAVDEPAEALGKTLKLPPQYEGRRRDIERVLPSLRVPG